MITLDKKLRFMRKCFLFLCCFFALTVHSQAQILSEGEARRELQNRGIDETEFRERMAKRGFDLDNFDPSQLSEIQRATEEVIREMESKQEQDYKIALDSIPADSAALDELVEEAIDQEIEEASDQTAEKIRRAIESGVPIEEAIANELSEKQNEELPEAKIYGQQVFRNKSIALYTPSEDIRPPETYVLGPGDEISILIWGKSQESASFTINKEGFIQPDRMPRIPLKGITYAKARSLLLSRYSEYFNFRKEDFEVTIDYSRTISVNIVGEAIESGTYNVPATNTAFNALVASGGPSDIGSVRNIKLMHPDGTSKNLDVYEFLLNPGIVKDYFLQNNDYLFIPIADFQVTVEGAIRRPFTYEMLPGEGLKKLILYAGGVTDNAYLKNIQITRYENDEEVIIDVDYRSIQNGASDFKLQKGDRILIKNIENTYENFVEVVGAVEFPGRFELDRSMRVSQALNKAKILKTARKDLAFLLRKNLDGSTKWIKLDIDNLNGSQDLELNIEDRIIVYDQARFKDVEEFVVSGAVRQPGRQPIDTESSLSILDAVEMAGGTLPEATDYAYVFRKNPQNQNDQEYIRIDFGNSSQAQQNVQPYDSIVVFNRKEFLQETTVRVEGAIKKPLTISYDPTLTVRDAITLAGGLRLEAAKSRVDVSRVIIGEDNDSRTVVETISLDENFQVNGQDYTLEPYDLIEVRTAPSFELQRNIFLKGEIVYPGKYSLELDNEKISDVLKKAGGLTKEAFPEGATLYRVKEGIGYVVLELDDVIRDKKSKHNFILKDGDILEIPKQKDFVAIRGLTKAKDIYPDKILKTGQINVPFYKSKNAKWYVDEFAAGVGEEGRRRLITVEHPNGRIEKTEDYLLFKKYPSVEKGSVITVGRVEEKKEEEKKERADIDWGKVFADAVAQATAIVTLIFIIENSN